MAYRNALQADALKLVARKLQSSLAVEGELSEEGLAAYGDDPVPGTGSLCGYLASRRKSTADMTGPGNHNFGVGGASS